MKDVKISIKAARGLSELTQQEVADRLGVTKTTYRNYEDYNTIMPVTTALKFSNIVNVDISDLIFFKEKVV